MKTLLKVMLFTSVMVSAVFAAPDEQVADQVVFSKEDLQKVVAMGQAVEALRTQVASLETARTGVDAATGLNRHQATILGNVLNGLSYMLDSKVVTLIGIAVLAGGMNTNQGKAITLWVKNSLTNSYGFVGTALWNVVSDVKYLVYDLPFKRDIEPAMKKLSTWNGRLEIATKLLLAVEAYCVVTDKTGPTARVFSSTAKVGNGAYNVGYRAYTNGTTKINSLRAKSPKA